MDHKTAQSETNIFHSWGQSLSQLGYVWSRQQFTGKPLEGFIMNILGWRKPAKSATLPRFFFNRVPCSVTQEQLDEWRVHVLVYAKNILEAMLTDTWPKSGDCFDYGAHCQYWDACLYPKERRENLLRTGAYKRNDWSPLSEGNV